MAEIRRGTAMLLLTAGDREISKALADGILAVRLPMAKPPVQEETKVVSAEMDRQRIAEELREEMHPEPVDYAGLMFDAEMSYGESVYGKGAARRALDMLLVGWAMVALGFERLFESVNGGR